MNEARWWIVIFSRPPPRARWENGVDGGVQRQRPVLDELHDGGARGGLGEGRHEEDGVVMDGEVLAEPGGVVAGGGRRAAEGVGQHQPGAGQRDAAPRHAEAAAGRHQRVEPAREAGPRGDGQAEVGRRRGLRQHRHAGTATAFRWLDEPYMYYVGRVPSTYLCVQIVRTCIHVFVL